MKISIVTPGYNEAENLEELSLAIKNIMQEFPEFQYEHIFIDNASTDNSADLLRKMAAHDKNLKVILNARNFGHIRSPYHGLLQATGDAAVIMASDLQDPPALVSEFIREWKAHRTPICIGIKETSDEGMFLYLRKLYYWILAKISDSPQIQNFTGFGLYDRKVLDVLRKYKDPYPFFRGMIAEIGFKRREFAFKQPLRKRGITKNNFLTLWDIGMLGMTSYSKLPLRMATFFGFFVGAISFLLGFSYLVYKLMYWDRFEVGMAPVVLGIFFLGSIQLFFLGMVGEYVGAIYTQVKERPLVVEAERINF
jgi:polyisoprenyl-phosphate glycosyltransferase